ncbi:MAG: cysteine synthase A [Clostridia bacterium]
MKIYNSVEELVGKTPLLKLNRFEKENNLSSNIFAKLELFNPAGSIKDRVAKAMIEKAEEQNLLNKDTVIIEPTSGNTGIGLASIGAAKGYKVILTMPESMSIERRNLLKAYGAEIVLTEAKLGMTGAIKKAESLVSETPNAFMPSQFENCENPQAHYNTTAVEIWEDMDGKIDFVVAGIGTGGTITGIGKYLKEKNKDIKIVGVEPFDSPFLTQGKAGPHKIQGIGAGFEPKILEKTICDEFITVTTEQAYENMKILTQTEGVLVGVSSGAALFAASEIAKKYTNKNIVVILPDTGERYLSIL